MNVERYIDFFCSMLQSIELKCTSTRQDILRLFFNDTHLSVNDILQQLAVSKQTVYATIKLLLSFNIITQERINGKSFYELSRGHNHFHLFCTQCKVYTEVKDEVLVNLMHKLGNINNFQADKLNITIYGTCRNCSSDNKYQ